MFIGRQQELLLLQELQQKPGASLVVCKGRRRIGKSALIHEFGKKTSRALSFEGLPPSRGITAKDQKVEFARQMSSQLKLPGLKAEDWGDLFEFLARQTAKGSTLILLDEISWMGMNDPTFLPKLKMAWDNFFSKNPKLILVICGSISSWIDENILSHTGFLGRISLELHLKELPLNACNEFWGKKKTLISPYEKLCFLGVAGGVPRYLEELKPSLPAQTNIEHLCFIKEGVLFNEFDRIFSDLFNKRAPLYKKIVTALSGPSLTAEQIFKQLHKEKSGIILNYLDDLATSGFISRDYTYKFDGTVSKLSKYRLSDNYVRFYLRYVEPFKKRILNQETHTRPLSSLKNWDTVMGLQFENLVLGNRFLVQQILGLKTDHITSDGPYFQNKTKSNKGACQIDYLIHTRFNTLYVCEIKFSRNKIGKEVIAEVQKKMDVLAKPKGFSLRPVLITACEVDASLEEEGFFDKIIRFEDLLTGEKSQDAF